MNRSTLTSLVLLLLLSGCQGDVPHTAPAAQIPADLRLWTVTPEQAARERVWDGVVEAVNQATLSAQTAGRVVELPYDVDDYVPAGAVVVRFTDVEQQSARRQAEAQLRAAEASAKEAEAEYGRIQDIYTRKLVAKSQLDQALARRDAARAALEAAQAGVQSAGEQVDYTVIRSPYSGIVTARHVQVGESVRPGQPLISGLSLGRLRVHVDLPQSDIGAIRAERKASVLLADGRRIEASKVTVFPYADPQSHTFKVRVELPEEETGLHPGVTVKVAFAIGAGERLLLPQAALVRRSEVSGVYVAGEQGLLLRQLRLGHRYGDRVEVLAGLNAGERIALDPLAASAALQSGSGHE